MTFYGRMAEKETHCYMTADLKSVVHAFVVASLPRQEACKVKSLAATTTLGSFRCQN